ncbi:MAG: Hpt domain-containing protein [Proteobacteria bacterium]|nr:MAG: Hpt domain-containing protein [Pseudomonadota bacterium]
MAPLDNEHLRVLKSLEKPGDLVSFLSDLILTFTRESPHSVRALHEALLAHNSSAAKHAAHQLKGLASNMGAIKLAALSEAIEIEIEEGRQPDSLDTKTVLERYRSEAIDLLVRDWKA